MTTVYSFLRGVPAGLVSLVFQTSGNRTFMLQVDVPAHTSVLLHDIVPSERHARPGRIDIRLKVNGPERRRRVFGFAGRASREFNDFAERQRAAKAYEANDAPVPANSVSLPVGKPCQFDHWSSIFLLLTVTQSSCQLAGVAQSSSSC